MEDTKIVLSQSSCQLNDDKNATSLAELKELADKLAAAGDKLTQIYSKNVNLNSWDLKKSLLSTSLIDIAMAEIL